MVGIASKPLLIAGAAGLFVATIGLSLQWRSEPASRTVQETAAPVDREALSALRKDLFKAK